MQCSSWCTSMSPKVITVLALVAFSHFTSAAQSQHDNAVVAQLQKSVTDLLAGFQQFSSHVERKLATVHSKVVALEKSSVQVERKLAMLVDRVTTMNSSQQDAQLRDAVAQLAGSVLSNTKSVCEGKENLSHLQDQVKEINATVQDNMEAIPVFSGRLNAHKENVQKRSNEEPATPQSDSVDELETQVEELGITLNSKLEALEAHTVYSTGCVQYLPTSCQEIAEKWPNSLSGHYQILSGNGTIITVYCYITSPPKPAPSCEAMMSLNLAIPAGEYWVTVENGSSQRVFCPSHSQPETCKYLFEKYPLTPAGVYWVTNETTLTASKAYCTSEEHPADSCDTILNSHPTVPSGYYWIVKEGEPQQLYCLRNDKDNPVVGTSCDSIFSISPTIPPGLYWIKNNDVVHAYFCDTEECPAASCELVLEFHSNYTIHNSFGPHWIGNGDSSSLEVCTSESHRWPGTCEELLNYHGVKAGLYWIKGHNSSVYCTSARHPASSYNDVLNANHTVQIGPYWVSIEDNLESNLSSQALQMCTSYNGTAIEVYYTSVRAPTSPCDSVLNLTSPPGYYWIDTANGSVACVYCTPNNQCCNSTGGWIRVANLDMTEPTQNCPQEFRLRTGNNTRTCVQINDTGCTSIFYETNGVQYSKVCGKVIAYQDYCPAAFKSYTELIADNYVDEELIDEHYVDGVSITHGHTPRNHIWTFAAALDELFADRWTCPCSRNSPYSGKVPTFIGNDYFCDSGFNDIIDNYYRFHYEDPLWDGEGCGPNSSCCTFNSPPWFCKHLSQPTTDDIEIRVCSSRRNNRDTPLEMMEIYIK